MKHLLTLALVLCLGAFTSAQIPSYVPTNGLVGWWPFNGNANDESGNGNNGTVNGATLAADRFGNPGKAYSFDGVDDWIRCIQSGPTGNPTISVNFWIKSTQSTYGHIIGYGSNGGGGENFRIYLGDNSCSQSIVFDTYDNAIAKTNSLANIWDFYTVIYNGVNGSNVNSTTIYKNGVPLLSNCSFVNISNTNISNNYPITFGKYHGTIQTGFFNGLLDDIAIYNRALSAAEVQQLYLGNCTPTFTAQPQNKSVAQGQTTTFAVQVDTTSTFQWQMNLGYGQNWVNVSNSAQISGATDDTLTVEGRYQIDGAQFRCIATACQSDTSNAATLTVTSNASSLGSVAGVPGKINYQGAAVDSLGKPMKNQTIALQLSVLDSSSTGAAAYVETHSTPTNGSGIFSLHIGGGTAVTGTFDSIPWANGRNKYLKTEVNQNGTWVNLGTSQLVSVPYALHAGSAENAKNAIFATNANYATFFKDSLGNAYQIKTVNGQPTLVSAPGNVSSPAPFACGQTVAYASESYPTVQIGSQCWFQKNVNAGTMVLGANDQTNNGILEKYCYDNNPGNCTTYGGLYQWAEAVQYQNGASNTTSPSPAFSGNIKGICPTGWHVPSDGESCTLTTFIDATVNCGTLGWSGTDVGGKMKSTSGLWTAPNIGATNSSGFSALPGGYRSTNGVFNGIGHDFYFWSFSESSSSGAIVHDLNYSGPLVLRVNNDKNFGFSIRCLKD